MARIKKFVQTVQSYLFLNENQQTSLLLPRRDCSSDRSIFFTELQQPTAEMLRHVLVRLLYTKSVGLGWAGKKYRVRRATHVGSCRKPIQISDEICNLFHKFFFLDDRKNIGNLEGYQVSHENPFSGSQRCPQMMSADEFLHVCNGVFFLMANDFAGSTDD
ncbi:MAG: hypothetical protein V4719_29065 [Planctomycetota bacterium]